jgi:adenine phosphoribosyltransferase
MTVIDELKKSIRDVPDFPKPGILFKDITPIFHDAKLCEKVTAELEERVKAFKPDAIVGIESRGFLFGFALAMKMGIPFVMVRKAGKMPYKKHSFEYTLEYGSAIVEMHHDSIQPGWNVLIHDDLLATGGTAIAASELIKMQGGKVAGFAFLIGLDFLDGQKKLNEISENIVSLVSYK